MASRIWGATGAVLSLAKFTCANSLHSPSRIRAFAQPMPLFSSSPRHVNMRSYWPVADWGSQEGKLKLARRAFLHLTAAGAALPVLSRAAFALDYPTRPVHMIVD